MLTDHDDIFPTYNIRYVREMYKPNFYNVKLRCILYILIRKRNAKKTETHFLEKDHFDGVLSDMANE